MLTSSDYVELSRLRESLELGVADDVELRFAIKAASRFVERYCRRKFFYDPEIVQKIKVGGAPFIVLDRTPVWSVTSLKNILNGTAVSLDESVIDTYPGILYLDQLPYPRNWLHSGIDGQPSPANEYPAWEITYEGGYTTPTQDSVVGVDPLPEDIQVATQMIATNIYQARGQDMRVRRLHVLEAAVWYHEGGIGVGVESILDQFRRVT